MNGKEPMYTDAVGNYIPRPLVPPRVASPINLLNPDRYEFYTFNDDGELVKRLMTMEEIQGIVANGDSEQQVLAKTPTGIVDNEANIRDIVNNVQKVLHKEMATNQNFTANLMYNKLDTPDTSSSWSSILPAIFGNTGEPVVSNKTPSPSTGSTADTVIVQHTTTSKKPIAQKTPSTTTTNKTTSPPKTTTKLSTKAKPKPSRPSSSSSTFSTSIGTYKPLSSTQKIKYSSTGVPSKVQSTVKNTVAPITKHQYSSSPQTTTFTPKPTKLVTLAKPSTSATKPTTNQQKVTNSISSTLANINRITASALNAIPTNKPSQSIGTKSDVTVKRPTSTHKYTSSLKTSSSPITTSSSTYSTKLSRTEAPTTKKYYITETRTTPPLTTQQYSSPQTTKKKTSTSSASTATTAKLKTPTQKVTTKIPSTTAKSTSLSSSHSTKKASSTTTRTIPKTTTPAAPITTKKSVATPQHTTTYFITDSIGADSLALGEPEPDNVFDSELSLNQIIESLKDLEGTTMPYAQSYMEFVETTTSNDMTMQPFEKVNTEAVTIFNNGQDSTTRRTVPQSQIKFKPPISNNVYYIPQTTYEPLMTDSFMHRLNLTDAAAAMPTDRSPVAMSYVGIQHKEGSDEIFDEKTTTESDITTTGSSKMSAMDNMLRESFDTVLMQIQNEGLSTESDASEMGTTTFSSEESTKMPANDRKKIVVKPTPYIPVDELNEGKVTEPMKYFEAVIKHYEKEKNKTESMPSTTQKVTTESFAKTTLRPIESDEFMTTEMGSEQSTTIDSSSSEYRTEEQQLPTTTQDTSTQERSTQSDESVALTTELSTEETTSAEYKTENLLRISADDEASAATTESDDLSTIAYYKDSTEKQESISLKTLSDESDEMFSTRANEDYTSTTAMASEESTSEESTSEYATQSDEQSTILPGDMSDESLEDEQTKYEMVQLIENISKTMTSSEKTLLPSTSPNSLERKEDSEETEDQTKSAEVENYTASRDEDEFSNLGEMPTASNVTSADDMNAKSNETVSDVRDPIKVALNRVQSTLDNLKATHPTLPPILNNLKMKVVNALKNNYAINLDPAPKQALGLEESTVNVSEDILEFTKFCNEVAFNFWNVLNNDGISSARSLSVSPFALNSMLSMLFLGARGRTSSEINDMLHLDDIVTFNPHVLFRNITESVDSKLDGNIFTNAFVRELLSDRSKGKMLSFYKDKVHQFYSGYVEEVNFNTVNDIIRRRTNLLIKKNTVGKINEYLKASNVWVKPPLAGVSANIYETDCSGASKEERDGEMFFQVLPAIRQRRLVPIPAVVYKKGFTAGYDPELDATAVAIGLSSHTISTVFVMPGQQGHSAPGDNLERLESVLMVNAVSKNAWRRLLATLMERPGLEVQIPRFTHRSFINATNALRKLGLSTLFDQNSADLRGITGATTRDMYVSDLIQINTFSTCGEDLSEHHHVEMYPAPPNKYRTIDQYEPIRQTQATTRTTRSTTTSSTSKIPIEELERERAFVDPIFDLKYLNLPLPLRPRQARIPEIPRLRFDKPFLYFVRHNPTGMVLYFGRFNPRLLP